MWNNNNNQPPIPFRNNQQNQNFGMPAPGFGFMNNQNQQGPGFTPNNNNNISNFGMMIHGVSQNMQNQFIDHIIKLEPLLINEMKSSKFKGSITNMAKLQPPKRELCILIDTFLTVTNQKVDVRIRVDKNFPNTAPKLYFKQPVEHNYINKATLEVIYNNYYTWGNNSKVTDILVETENYFNKDSPFTTKEQEKMRKIMVRVQEQSFKNLVEMNLDLFYNNLSASEKEKVKDQIECAELLKKTSQYKHLEEALRILVKCNSNLYDTVVRERRQLEDKIIDFEKMKTELEDSKMNLVTIYNTSNLLQQRFSKLNVITHLENTNRELENQCNPKEIKERFSTLTSTSAAEAYLDELVQLRKEINKNAIICTKLKSV